MGKPTELVQGTLDLLILKTISLEPMNGWAIAKRIVQVSGDVLRVQQGSLYPALHRLEHQGWIRSDWKDSENNRRAKLYSLTAAGRKRLKSEVENWYRLSSAIGLVIEAVPRAGTARFGPIRDQRAARDLRGTAGLRDLKKTYEMAVNHAHMLRSLFLRRQVEIDLEDESEIVSAVLLANSEPHTFIDG